MMRRFFALLTFLSVITVLVAVPTLHAQQPLTVHVVQTGETLGVIARQYGVSIQTLAQLNGIINPDLIYAGFEMQVPQQEAAEATSEAQPAVEATSTPATVGEAAASSAPVTVAQAQGSGNTDGIQVLANGDVNYTVQPGDVLDLIGAGFDVQIACITTTNNLENPNVLKAGQTLLISSACPRYDGEAGVLSPRDGSASASTGTGVQEGQGGGTEATVAQPGPNDRSYVIQPGDVLDVIAQQYDVSLISLQSANRLFSARDVVPGLTIIIPGDAPPYGVVPPTVAVAGSIPDNIGQGGGTEATVIQPGQVEGVDALGVLYTVQPGDNILTIAAKLGISPAELVAANELFSSVELQEGIQLVIP